ncbi:hypothetical protein AFLA_001587 [Aspergillus flavus NRRL3357]|nr:hypothetical protein AFLA_001587 [Aspergillus flavus NRRL3357]
MVTDRRFEQFTLTRRRREVNCSSRETDISTRGISIDLQDHYGSDSGDFSILASPAKGPSPSGLLHRHKWGTFKQTNVAIAWVQPRNGLLVCYPITPQPLTS